MRALSLGSSRPTAGEVLVWAGRLIAVPLLLVWGAFLVEHMSQWFLQSGNGFPPAWVWIAQIFHVVMVVGLVAMLRWEKVGSVLVVVGTAGFVMAVGDSDILWLSLTNLVPVVCFATARVTSGEG